MEWEGKKREKPDLDSKFFDNLEKLKNVPPSTLSVAIVQSDREVRRAAMRLALTETDAAAIIAGDGFMGTLENTEHGIQAGAPMDEENLVAYNRVRASCFLLASWKKSVEDFSDWQQRRDKNWGYVQLLQEIILDLPLSLPDDELKKYKTKLKEMLVALKIDHEVILAFQALLSEDLELTIYRAKLEEFSNLIIEDILSDSFAFYKNDVDEAYIEENCGVLWEILQFAYRTFIIRNRSLQGRAFEADELSGATKAIHQEGSAPTPEELNVPR